MSFRKTPKKILNTLVSKFFSKSDVEEVERASSRVRQAILLTSLPLIGIVTAYAVGMQNEDVKPVPISKVIERLAAPESPKYNKKAFYWKDIFVKEGDSVGSILRGLGNDGKEAEAFIYSNPVSKKLLRLHIDQPISVYINDEGGMSAVQFFNDDENGEKILVAIEKNAQDDQWKITTDELETETIETVKMIRVNTSARGNLAQAEVPADIRESLSEIFSDQFSLSDLKEGDVIRLIYESLYYHGQEVATGNILVAEITKDGKNYSAYYYEHDDNQTGSYYDASGISVKKGFEMTPVSGARVSSGFGMRRHPILGSYRLHSGIDYAVVTGTPIVAPADGVVAERGVKGGYGNAIVLTHKDGMQTLYAHMSRFKEGISIGQKIDAGTVIGYVGSTGRSTGPHLHYEVRVNGQAVDPSTSALPTRTLSSGELTAYFKTHNTLNEKLALIKFDYDKSGTNIAQGLDSKKESIKIK